MERSDVSDNGEDANGLSKQRLYVLIAIFWILLVTLIVGLLFGASASRWFFAGTLWAGLCAYIIAVVYPQVFGD